MHLLQKGFMKDYLCWYVHGELLVRNESMVERMVGSTSSASNVHEVINDNNNPYKNMVMYAIRMNQGNANCINHSKLSVLARVFTIKFDYGLSEVSYDRIVEWVRNILPEGNRLKENFYVAKSMMKPLDLGYQKIDMCPNFCMLYFENVKLTECMAYGYSRYKPRTGMERLL